MFKNRDAPWPRRGGKMALTTEVSLLYLSEMNPKFNFPSELPIWVDQDRMSGAPCFKGTRVPVDSLVTNLASGLSLADYLECFPEVTREQAVAVLAYMAKAA